MKPPCCIAEQTFRSHRGRAYLPQRARICELVHTQPRNMGRLCVTWGNFAPANTRSGVPPNSGPTWRKCGGRAGRGPNATVWASARWRSPGVLLSSAEVAFAHYRCGLCACLQPSERLISFSAREHLNIGMHKVLDNLGGDLQECIVGDGGNAVDLAVMIAHEFHVLDKRAEAVPSRKGWRLDQQSGQFPLFIDVGVDCARNLMEIIGRKGAPRLHDQHTGILQKLELDH